MQRLCIVLMFLQSIGNGLLAQTISQVNPLSASVGSAITITGSGFSSTPANNVVWFGIGKGTVLTANATSLSVQVPSSATYGFVRVTVLGTGNTATSSLPFDPQFTSGDIDSSLMSLNQTLSLGGSPIRPVLVDMNGDGKLDLLVSRSITSPQSPTIAYYQNTTVSGNISFAPKAEISAGDKEVVKILTGDFDGDGKQDFVFVSQTSVRIFRDIGTPGSPNFQLWKEFTNPDMTGGSWQVQSGQIKIGQAVGLFISIFARTSPPTSFPDNSVVWVPNYITNMFAQDAVIADFNGDGKPDIAIVYEGTPSLNIHGRVRVLFEYGK